MRLFTKYFLFGMLVLGVVFSFSGYLLLHYSMESSLAREAEFALTQYQYDKFTVQSAMLSNSDIFIVVDEGEELFPDNGYIFSVWKDYPYDTSRKLQLQGSREVTDGGLVKSLFAALAEEISSPVAFFAEDGTLIYSEIQEIDASFLEGLSEKAHVYQFRDTPEGGCVLVGSILDCSNLGIVEGIWNVTEDYQGMLRVMPEEGEGIVGNEVERDGKEREDTVGYEVEGDGKEGGAESKNSAEGETAMEWDRVKAVEQNGSAEGNLADAAEYQTDSLESHEMVYFVTRWDISKTIGQQQTLRQYFIRCYLIAMTAGMALLGILSAFLTRPLKRMSKAAGRMAEGYYQERLAISGKDEIGELAGSFNRMADAVEEKIGELSRAAREKEDFVANFAHELKTPLTSIIGYADTIYQKDLPREDIRRASWNIWNEGMRLEALSFKLLELTVLGRQTFPLVEMPADELLQDVAESLAPLMEEKKIDLKLEAEQAYIKVDYDLLKTLLINLVDNSVKAGAERIELWGQRKEEASSAVPKETLGASPKETLRAVPKETPRASPKKTLGASPKETLREFPWKYLVRVRDNGCGMEEEVLSRITEAFYMVDKARSRKQHGAGLGLALADRIARVHGSALMFESRKGQGTEVSFLLEMSEADWPENEEENSSGAGNN